MARLEHYYTRFEFDGVYHVYNRAIDRKALFIHPDNRRCFLAKLKQYTQPVLDVYAYNLLGNHFHLLVRVKSQADLEQRFGAGKEPPPLVSNAFKVFFQTYALAFNRQQGRVGGLFQTPVKRARIPNDDVLVQELWYVHTNALLHGLAPDLREWPHGSFGALCSDAPTALLREAVWGPLRWKRGICSVSLGAAGRVSSRAALLEQFSL